MSPTEKAVLVGVRLTGKAPIIGGTSYLGVTLAADFDEITQSQSYRFTCVLVRTT